MAQPVVPSWNLGEIAFQTSDLLNADLSAAAGTILNPEGKGDVLIFPYFDVRVIDGQPQDTYFAIINEVVTLTFGTPDAGGVAAKLRFREWMKSEEVFDADIWLSINDVWVGVLTRNTTNGLTRIYSPDWVITAGTSTSTTFTVQKTLINGFDFFSNLVPGGSSNTHPAPAGWTAADMTNLGYFEVIGEERTYSKQSGGIVTRVFLDCPNWLSGYAYIVSVNSGVAHGYNASAIANFRRINGTLFVGPGDTAPDLSQGEDGLDQLEFQLSKANVSHGYSIEPDILGKFSMIITFPTKRFHFAGRPNYTMLTGGTLGRPYTGEHADAGELIRILIWDRDENPFSPPDQWWSPRDVPRSSLLTELNIVDVINGTCSGYPSPTIRGTQCVPTGGFISGWIWFDLTGDGTAVVHYGNPYSNTEGVAGPYRFANFGEEFIQYHGLPTLSLAFQDFWNLTIGAVGGAYGSIFPAFYEVDWVYDGD